MNVENYIKPNESCINCGAEILQTTAVRNGGVCQPCSCGELAPAIQTARLVRQLEGYETQPFYDAITERFWIPEIIEYLPESWIRMLRLMIESGDIRALLASFPNYSVIEYLIRSGYASKLVSKRRQLEYKDYYGDYNLDAWFEELDRFIEKRLFRLQEAAEHIPQPIRDLAIQTNLENYLLFDKLISLTLPIDDFTSSAICDIREREEIGEIDEPKLPLDYEKFVGRSFSENGWLVQYVGGTGDQGADLLVTKDDTTAVVQCKFYQKPVGNSGVQEALAAKSFYDADAAIVVASSDFTKSCRQLADSCKVILMVIATPGKENDLI